MMSSELQTEEPTFLESNLFLQPLVSHEIVCATETVLTNFLNREKA